MPGLPAPSKGQVRDDKDKQFQNLELSYSKMLLVDPSEIDCRIFKLYACMAFSWFISFVDLTDF